MAVNEARVAVITPGQIKTESPTPSAGGHESLSRSTTVVTSLVAGAFAGAIAKTAIAPLDRTKINFQISKTPYSWRGAAQFILESARREGLAALWRGNSATMARIVPYSAVQFTAHEQCKRLLGVDSAARARASPLRLLLAGSLAGCVSQSLTYPLDVARARMAVSAAAACPSLRHVFAQLVRAEGLSALYRGYTATILGVIPYAGVSFFTYDTVKRLYHDYTGSPMTGAAAVLGGGAAGALAQTASYPLDIIRRRMQTQPQRRSMTYTARRVYRTEGCRGFFKGLSMNWLKGPLAVGISFATYDLARAALRDLALAAGR